MLRRFRLASGEKPGSTTSIPKVLSRPSIELRTVRQEQEAQVGSHLPQLSDEADDLCGGSLLPRDRREREKNGPAPGVRSRRVSLRGVHSVRHERTDSVSSRADTATWNSAAGYPMAIIMIGVSQAGMRHARWTATS